MGRPILPLLISNRLLPIKFNQKEIIYSVFSLVKEYTGLNEQKETGRWLEEGLHLFPQLSKNTGILFEKHFNVYSALHSGNKEKIENTLVDAFEFFNRTGKNKQTKVYAKKLAEFYANMGQYKNAVIYYKKIVE